MISGGAPAIESDLATGTTATSRARRRWPILDVHDVKQQTQNFHVRRNQRFRRRASNARNLHADRFRRCPSSPRSPAKENAASLVRAYDRSFGQNQGGNKQTRIGRDKSITHLVAASERSCKSNKLLMRDAADALWGNACDPNKLICPRSRSRHC